MENDDKIRNGSRNSVKKKREISNRAGCVHRRNKCMQDALWSLGAGWWGVGVGRRKGWRRTREAMELNARRRRGYIRRRGHEIGTCRVQRFTWERGRKKERERKGWKDEKNKRNRPRCIVKRARDAPRDDVPPLPPPSSFLLREHVRGRIYGGRWRVARPERCIASSARGASCKVHSDCLPDCTGRRGALLPLFSPLVYIYISCNLRRPHTPRGAAALSCKWEKCSRMCAREVMRKCKRCTRAFGHHADDRYVLEWLLWKR